MKNYREISIKINEVLKDATSENFLSSDTTERLSLVAKGLADDIDRKITVDANPERMVALNNGAEDDEYGVHGADGQGVVTINGTDYKVENVNYERYTAEDGTEMLRLRNIYFKTGEFLRFAGEYAFFKTTDVIDVLKCEKSDYPVMTAERAEELGIVEYDKDVYSYEELSEAPTEFRELTSRNPFFESAFDALKTFSVEGRKYDSETLRDSREAVLDCVSRMPAKEISFYGEKFAVNEVTTRIDNSLHLSETDKKLVIEIANGTFPGYSETLTLSAETKEALKGIPSINLIETENSTKLEIDTERFVKTDEKGNVLLDTEGFEKVLDDVRSALDDFHYTVETDELLLHLVESRDELFANDEAIDEILDEETKEGEKITAFLDLRNSGVEKFDGNFGVEGKGENINKAIVNVETGEFRFVYAFKNDDGIEYFKESENSPTFRLSENWVDVTECFKGQNMKGGLFKAMERAYKKINAGNGTEFFTPTEIESVSNLMSAADMFISKMSSEDSLTAARFMYETISNYVNPIEKYRLASEEGVDTTEGKNEKLRALELEGKMVEPTGKTIEQMVKDGTALEQFIRTGTRVEVAYDALMDFVGIQSKDGGQSSRVGGTPLAQRVWAPITLGTKFIGYLIGNLIWRKHHHLENVVSIRDCFKMAWASAPFLALVDATEYKKNRFSRTPNAIMQLELKKNLVRENNALRMFEKAAGIDYEGLVGITKNKMSAIEILNETILLERGVGSEKKENILERYKNISAEKRAQENTLIELEEKLKTLDSKKDKKEYNETLKEIEKTKEKIKSIEKNKIYEKVKKGEEAKERLEKRALSTKPKEDKVSELKAELGALKVKKEKGEISEEEFNKQKAELEEKLTTARKELSIERNGKSEDLCSDFKQLVSDYKKELSTETSDYKKEVLTEKIKLLSNLAEGTADRPADKIFKSLKDTIAKIEPNKANEAKIEAWKGVLQEIGDRLTNSEKVAVAYDVRNELFTAFNNIDIALEFKVAEDFDKKDLISEAIEIVDGYIESIELEKNGNVEAAKEKFEEFFGSEGKIAILKEKLEAIEAKENPTAAEKRMASIVRNFIESNVDTIFAKTEFGASEYFESESEILAIMLECGFTALPEDKKFERSIISATDRINEIQNNGAHAEISKINIALDDVNAYERNSAYLFGDKEKGTAGEINNVKKFLEGKLNGISPEEFFKELKKVIGVKAESPLTYPGETEAGKQKSFLAKNVSSEYLKEVTDKILELEKTGSTFVSEQSRVTEIASELGISDVSDVAKIVETLEAQKKECLDSPEFKGEEAEIASEQAFISVVENAKKGKEGRVARYDLIAKESGLEIKFDNEQSKFVPYESSYLSVELIELDTISESSVLDSIEKDLLLASKIYKVDNIESIIPEKDVLVGKSSTEIHQLYVELFSDGTLKNLDSKIEDVISLCETISKSETLLEKQILAHEKNNTAVERIRHQAFKKKGKSTLRDTAVSVNDRNGQAIEKAKEIIANLKVEKLSAIEAILPEMKNELLLILQELENCKAGHLESSSQEVKILEEKAEDLKLKISKLEEFKEKFELSLEKTEKTSTTEATEGRTVEDVLASFEKYKYKTRGDSEYKEIRFEKTADPKTFTTPDKAFKVTVEGAEPLFDATLTVNEEVVVEGKEIIEDFVRTCELKQVEVLQVENLKLEEFTDIEKSSESGREAEMISDHDKTSVEESEKSTSEVESGEHKEDSSTTPVETPKETEETSEKVDTTKEVKEEKPVGEEEKKEKSEENKKYQKDKLTKVLEKSFIDYVCKKRGVEVEGKFKKAVDAYYKDAIAKATGPKKAALELFYKYNATPFADTIDTFRRIFEVIKTFFTGKTEKAEDVKLGDIIVDRYSMGAESTARHQFWNGEHLSADGKTWEKAANATQKKIERIKYLESKGDVWSKILSWFIEQTDAKVALERAKAKVDRLNAELGNAKTDKERKSINHKIERAQARVKELENTKFKFFGTEVRVEHLEASKVFNGKELAFDEKALKELATKFGVNVDAAREKAFELSEAKDKLESAVGKKSELEKELKKVDKAIEKTTDPKEKEALEKRKAELKEKVGEVDKEIVDTEAKVETLEKELHAECEKIADNLDNKIETGEKVEAEEQPEVKPVDTENNTENNTENPVAEEEPDKPEGTPDSHPEVQEPKDEVTTEKNPDEPVKDVEPVDTTKEVEGKSDDHDEDTQKDLEKNKAEKGGEKPSDNPQENPENNDAVSQKKAELDSLKTEQAKLDAATTADETSTNAVSLNENGVNVERLDGMTYSEIYENSTRLTKLEFDIPDLDGVKITANATLAPDQDGRTAREFYTKQNLDADDSRFETSEIKADNAEDKIREVLAETIDSKKGKIMFEFNDKGQALVDVEIKNANGETKKKKIKLEDIDKIVNGDKETVENVLESLPEQMTSDLALDCQDLLQQEVFEIQTMGAEGGALEDAVATELSGVAEGAGAGEIEAAIEAAEAAVAAEAAEAGEAAAAIVAA